MRNDRFWWLMDTSWIFTLICTMPLAPMTASCARSTLCRAKVGFVSAPHAFTLHGHEHTERTKAWAPVALTGALSSAYTSVTLSGMLVLVRTGTRALVYTHGHRRTARTEQRLPSHAMHVPEGCVRRVNKVDSRLECLVHERMLRWLWLHLQPLQALASPSAGESPPSVPTARASAQA